MTVRLPFVARSDLRSRTDGKTPRGKTHAVAKARDKRRAARMVKAAEEQGGLLTIAELSVILNKSYSIDKPASDQAIIIAHGCCLNASNLPSQSPLFVVS